MAIFHCSFKNILRSEGRSSVAAAAYRAGEKITNIYDGITHDFTRKDWIVHTEIMLPPNAPPEYADRSTLWNSVEAASDSPKDRLARECEVALPRELSMEKNIALVRKFVQEQFVHRGMCADIAIHNPPIRDDLGRPLDANGNVTADPDKMIFNNPHAHILLTVRALDEKGKWAPKTEAEYVCRRGAEERRLTGKEFRQMKAEGWEKQYRYSVNGENRWMTSSEATAFGLKPSDRVFKSARMTVGGRENPVTAAWNAPERIPEWRKAWADAVNQALARAGVDERVDHRSFAGQGRADEIPTDHIGPSAHYSDRRHARTGKGSRSDRGSINDSIKDHNESARIAREIKDEIDHQLHDKAAALEHIRVGAAASDYFGAIEGVAAFAIDAERYHLDEMEAVERELRVIAQLNRAALRTIEDILQLINGAGSIALSLLEIHQGRIEKERADIDARTRYEEEILRRYDCKDVDEFMAMYYDLRDKVFQEELKRQEAESARKDYKTKEDYMGEYRKILDSIPKGLRQELEKVQDDISTEDGSADIEILDKDAYDEALARIDKEIDNLKRGKGLSAAEAETEQRGRAK